MLTAYSDKDRSLTFEGVGLPRIVRRARDTQSVQATGPDTSTVVFEILFDLLGLFSAFVPVIQRRMARTFTELLSDSKSYVGAAV